jgi:hypothetical protein
MIKYSVEIQNLKTGSTDFEVEIDESVVKEYTDRGTLERDFYKDLFNDYVQLACDWFDFSVVTFFTLVVTRNRGRVELYAKSTTGLSLESDPLATRVRLILHLIEAVETQTREAMKI